MPRLTVIWDPDGAPWCVELDGVLLDTVPGHYDAWETLSAAERYAPGPVAWRRIGDGNFEAVATEGNK